MGKEIAYEVELEWDGRQLVICEAGNGTASMRGRPTFTDPDTPVETGQIGGGGLVL